MNKERENIEFFVVEDFLNLDGDKYLNIEGLATRRANQKLNQALGPKVVGYQYREKWHFGELEEPGKDTHEALLFNVREIVKECTHSILVPYDGKLPMTAKCHCCGKQLVAKWTVAE